MTNQMHPIVQVLQDDNRYSIDAYQFIRQALSFGQGVMGLGEVEVQDDKESSVENPFLAELEEELKAAGLEDEEAPVERHLTGQQLCDAIRRYAVEQYGYMAKTVLNSWGVHTTGDFGEIVYNMIRVGIMKTSKNDRREDFEDCYDFEEAFQQQFEFTVPEE